MGSPAVDGGVELGAVGELAGVVDGVPLVRHGERAGADLGVDVAEEKLEDSSRGSRGVRRLERGDVVELDGGTVARV